MKVQARLNNYRRSAQKVRRTASVIKGLSVADALGQLEYLKDGSAEILKKLLLSAVANAENNHGLSKDNLVVLDLIAEEGRTLKRWRARAYGRAARILKRTCSVVLILEDVTDAKGKKAKKSEVKKNSKPSGSERRKDAAKEKFQGGKDPKEAKKTEKSKANKTFKRKTVKEVKKKDK